MCVGQGAHEFFQMVQMVQMVQKHGFRFGAVSVTKSPPPPTHPAPLPQQRSIFKVYYMWLRGVSPQCDQLLRHHEVHIIQREILH